MEPILSRDQAEMIFDEIDVDGSRSVDMEEFANAWADIDAQYAIGRLNPLGKRGFTRGASSMLGSLIRRPSMLSRKDLFSKKSK
jgi:hypothetical protein